MSDEQHSQEELAECLQKMQAASDAFYMAAIKTGNHTFIEFTGLMNEYIKVCHDAAKQGTDFMIANTHSGVAIPLQPYHVAYLAEKLNCIYGPGLMAGPNRAEFCRAVIGDSITAGKFNIGDLVEWSSQAGGTPRTKRGVVIEVVQPREIPKTKMKDIGLGGRREESYVVEASYTDGPDHRRKQLFWPRTSQLRQAGRKEGG